MGSQAYGVRLIPVTLTSMAIVFRLRS